MSPEEIRDLVIRNKGRRVTLHNDRDNHIISGVIDEVAKGHLLWVRHDDGGRTVTRLPTKPVRSRRSGPNIIFEFSDKLGRLVINYRLTITTA